MNSYLLSFRSLVFVSIILPMVAFGADPATLPSWENSTPRQTILDFVKKVTDESSSEFLQPSDRIAVFDNDGTLWSEKPVYTQIYFAIDRVKAMADQNPDWKTTQPFKAALEDDFKTLVESGKEGILKLIMATHAGMSVSDFDAIVKEWIATAKHPETGKLFTEMVYQPMLEVLNYLRGNGFKTFIVSGGGIDFMRPWAESVYGIPPEQVIGSSVKIQFEVKEGTPTILRLPEIDFIDDGPGKPVGIQKHIGKKPVISFGNSDGDLQMLQWTAVENSPSLGVIIHHTDEVREWAYDKDSAIGKLDMALQVAAKNQWTVVSMKDDWKEVFVSPQVTE